MELYEKDKDITPPKEKDRELIRTKAIIKYIKNQLGGQVLDLELTDDQIKEIIDDSFKEVKHFIGDLYHITVDYQKCIDLTEYHIDSVESVLRANDTLFGNFNNILPGAGYGQILGLYNNPSYAQMLQAKRTINTISTDMQFVWDKPNRKLYTTCNMTPPNQVTITYKPEYYSIEDIKDDYWDTQIRKLSLGQCKIAIGRIRSKYTTSTGKFQLDGEKLIQEGINESTEVRNHLDINRDIFTVLN